MPQNDSVCHSERSEESQYQTYKNTSPNLRTRPLSVPLTDGFRNILMNIPKKMFSINSSPRGVDELNKILNNVCIIRVKLTAKVSVLILTSF